MLSKSAFLYKGDSHGTVDVFPPDSLLDQALILVLRLLSRIPGFSFSASGGSPFAGRVQTLMESVTAEVERLEGLIRSELVGSRRRNREIRKACDLVRAEIAAMRSG